MPGIAGIAKSAEPELSVAPFGPRRGRNIVLEGHLLPERVPGGEEFDDASSVPEGFPLERSRSHLPAAESPPLHRLPYLNSPCESSPPASSRLRPLRDGSHGVLAQRHLGSLRVVPTSPSPVNRRPRRRQGPRPVLAATGRRVPPWRCRSSPFPSLHLPSGARSRSPGPCPPGVLVSGLPAPHAPLQGFAPRIVGPADNGCRLPVARLGFPSRVLAAVALVTGSSSQARTGRVAGVSPDRPPSRFQHRPPSVAAPGALETHKRLR